MEAHSLVLQFIYANAVEKVEKNKMTTFFMPNHLFKQHPNIL